MLSGSTEEPDNTNGSKSNHQHKEVFWRQVEMRNLTYTPSPHSPFAALTGPPKGGKRALTDPVKLDYPKFFVVDLLHITVRFN